MTPTMLTVAEAARLIHVHPNTIRRYGTNGELKSYRMGNKRGDRRFYESDVRAFLNGYAYKAVK
jgi:excisionase family DNA binding protein